MGEGRLPRLLIGATGSGSGKTTFTCGLLRALSDRGRKPVSFKCGPDYIDPMFHTEALGVPSTNLDLFFTEENTVAYLMAKHGRKGDIGIVEGVMGYYDGLAGISTKASTYDFAATTGTPAVLLVDGRGKSVSLLAEIKGFLELKGDSRIKGIVLNRVSGMMYPELKKMIEACMPVKVYGYLPRMEDCSLESRHLGLVTAKEVKDLQNRVQKLAAQMKKSVDLEGLLKLAESARTLSYVKPHIPEPLGHRVSIAAACDKAFCFYYQDNLDLLEELGATIVPFSPLQDRALPAGVAGLMLGGGYPELYLQELSENTSMKAAIKKAIRDGMPCLAECGGFMYLHEKLKSKEGRDYEMAGLIQGIGYPVGKLVRFGYITLRAETDNLLCRKGELLKGHEFHYWDSTRPGAAFHAQKPLGKKEWDCVVAEKNLFAGYPHIYFYWNPETASNFLKACYAYRKGREL